MSAQTPREIPHNAVTLDQQNGKIAVWLTILTVASLLVVYFKTTWSMIEIWERSDTFAHGFLIFPFSAYLIWGQRKFLSGVQPQPNLMGLLVLAMLGFSWLLATLASVLVFQQLFLITMIPAVVWTILGGKMVRALAFPLAYLLLAVPFGEALIPPLIDFTADFTVKALQLTGIPVYREGSFFTIPSGNWSVVEACSGLRYLIASFTLGTLYAYLTYRSLARRIAFVALSLIVPIFANGIRAYLIVMTGHLSDMSLAVGVDHLIYGWIFFGFVMMLLFWIGSIWREDDKRGNTLDAGPQQNGLSNNDRSSPKGPIGAVSGVFAVSLIWPLFATYLENDSPVDVSREIKIADVSGKWSSAREPISDWRPIYAGATSEFRQRYRNSDSSVDLYISYYRNQQQGSELISSQNVLVPESGTSWRHISEGTRDVALSSGRMVLKQNQLDSPSINLLVWRWYWLGDEVTANPYLAKMILAKRKLLGRGDDGAEILLAAPYEDSPDETVPVLREFMNEMMPAITAGLEHASNR
jgi:exosortase A